MSANRRGDAKITVLIPALNEEATIESAVEEVQLVAASLPVAVSLLLIDDGSTDGTLDRMEALAQRLPACKVRHNPRNLGVGRSVLEAYQELPATSWATVFPADNEIVFESIRDFIGLMDDYDIILGYLKNPVIRPLGRRLASQAFTKTVNLLFGFDFKYLNGLKLYRVSAFQGLDVKASGHAFNAELLAKAILRNPLLRIGQAPFLARGRASGHSKAMRPLSITRALWEVLRGVSRVAAYRKQLIRTGTSHSSAPTQ